MAERLTPERLAEIRGRLENRVRSADALWEAVCLEPQTLHDLLAHIDAQQATLDEYRKQFAEDQGRINRLRVLLGEAREALQYATDWIVRGDHSGPHGDGRIAQFIEPMLAKLAQEGLS